MRNVIYKLFRGGTVMGYVALIGVIVVFVLLGTLARWFGIGGNPPGGYWGKETRDSMLQDAEVDYRRYEANIAKKEDEQKKKKVTEKKIDPFDL